MREIPNTWQELLFLIASWKHRFSLLHQSRLRRRQQLGLLRPVELGPEVTVSSQQARYITREKLFVLRQSWEQVIPFPKSSSVPLEGTALHQQLTSKSRE